MQVNDVEKNVQSFKDFAMLALFVLFLTAAYFSGCYCGEHHGFAIIESNKK